MSPHTIIQIAKMDKYLFSSFLSSFFQSLTYLMWLVYNLQAVDSDGEVLGLENLVFAIFEFVHALVSPSFCLTSSFIFSWKSKTSEEVKIKFYKLYTNWCSVKHLIFSFERLNIHVLSIQVSNRVTKCHMGEWGRDSNLGRKVFRVIWMNPYSSTFISFANIDTQFFHKINKYIVFK